VRLAGGDLAKRGWPGSDRHDDTSGLVEVDEADNIVARVSYNCRRAESSQIKYSPTDWPFTTRGVARAGPVACSLVGESGVPHNARRAVGEPSGGQPTCELLVRREEQFAGRVELGLRPSTNCEHGGRYDWDVRAACASVTPFRSSGRPKRR
jgi:hypothetical protein